MENKELESEPWYAVKCLFSHPTRAKENEGTLFEERVTLWKAGSWDESFEMAEQEAEKYALEADCVFIKATDAFHLFNGEVGIGTEVWSTMRSSHLDSEVYINTFCISDRDRAESPEDED